MSSIYSSLSEQIKICIRIRPFLSNEKSFSSSSPIITDENDDQKICIGRNTSYYESYFDRVFFPSSSQQNIYDYVKFITKDVLKGINATILAYGQTGSGKTYTMFGKDWTMQSDSEIHYNNDEFNFLSNDVTIDPFDEGNGIVPRVIYDIFNSEINNDFDIKCSFVQIYNEKIYDLLDGRKYDVNHTSQFRIKGKNDISTVSPINQPPLVIRENKEYGIFIDNLIQKKVDTFYDCISILKYGENNRKKRQTSKNDLSSRSHTMLMITFESKSPDKEGYMISSRINLCDLAGSEKYDKDYNYNKYHLNELIYINKSLSALGNVINALANKKIYVPFKDSKLTMLLQNSLGGNTRTILFANISPLMSSYDETLSTLKFADRAHSLLSKIEPNKILSTNGNSESADSVNNIIIIDKLTKEVNELRQLLNIRQRNGLVGYNSLSNGKDIEKELLSLRKENEKLKKQLRQVNSTLSPKSTESINYSYHSVRRENVLQKAGSDILKSSSVTRSNDNKNSIENSYTPYKMNDKNYLTLKILEKMELENKRRMEKEIEEVKKRTQMKRSQIVYV